MGIRINKFAIRQHIKEGRKVVHVNRKSQIIVWSLSSSKKRQKKREDKEKRYEKRQAALRWEMSEFQLSFMVKYFKLKFVRSSESLHAGTVSTLNYLNKFRRDH